MIWEKAGRRDKTRLKNAGKEAERVLTFNCSQPTLSLSLFLSFSRSTRFICLRATMATFYFLRVATTLVLFYPPLPSARVFRDRFRAGLHAARERFNWRTANAGPNCFRQSHLNDIFPFLTRVIVLPPLVSSACLRSNIFFFFFFFFVPEIFNRVQPVHDSRELWFEVVVKRVKRGSIYLFCDSAREILGSN